MVTLKRMMSVTRIALGAGFLVGGCTSPVSDSPEGPTDEAASRLVEEGSADRTDASVATLVEPANASGQTDDVDTVNASEEAASTEPANASEQTDDVDPEQDDDVLGSTQEALRGGHGGGRGPGGFGHPHGRGGFGPRRGHGGFGHRHGWGRPWGGWGGWGDSVVCDQWGYCCDQWGRCWWG